MLTPFLSIINQEFCPMKTCTAHPKTSQTTVFQTKPDRRNHFFPKTQLRSSAFPRFTGWLHNPYWLRDYRVNKLVRSWMSRIVYRLICGNLTDCFLRHGTAKIQSGRMSNFFTNTKTCSRLCAHAHTHTHTHAHTHTNKQTNKNTNTHARISFRPCFQTEV